MSLMGVVMKYVLLLLIGLNVHALEFKCHVIMSSNDSYPDNLIIPSTASKEDCIKKAKELFKKNNYTKLYIFLDKKIVEIKVEDEK